MTLHAKPYITTKPSIFDQMSVMAKKHNVINFTQGAPDFKTPQWLIERLNYYCQHGNNQYAPIPGSDALKQAIAKKIKQCYEIEINGDSEVLISSGVSESIYALISAYIHKGDEVIYFDPAFDAYPNVVAINQGVSRRLPLLASGEIDIEALAQTINVKTKLIILNSPHNPMGSVISKTQYQAVAELIKGKDILLLSDEVYEHIYAGDTFTSALQVPALKSQLVVAQSLGKTYNLTGWRMGACIAPEAIITMLNAIKQFMSFSAPHPMQLALADGINTHPEYWRTLPQLYQTQHHKLVDMLKNSRFKVLPWAGSPFQILDYSQISSEDDFSFCQRLIVDHGVGLVPISSLYEKPQQGLVRLCFAKYDDVLLAGAKKLCQI